MRKHVDKWMMPFFLFADKRYGYGSSQVGSVIMVVGVVSSVVQMLLTGPATRKLGEGNVIKPALGLNNAFQQRGIKVKATFTI
jgi:hypothetical protein